MNALNKQLLLFKGTHHHNHFKNSPRSSYQEAFSNSAQEFFNLQSALDLDYQKRLYSGEVAVLIEKETVGYSLQEYMDIFRDDRPFYVGSERLVCYLCGFVLRKDSPLTPIMDGYVSRLQSSGIIDHLIASEMPYEFWTIRNNNGGKKKGRQSANVEAFGVEHFSLVFMWLGMGVAVALMVFLIELIH